MSLAASEDKGKTSFQEDISGNREVVPPENTTKEVKNRQCSLVGNLPSRDNYSKPMQNPPICKPTVFLLP